MVSHRDADAGPRKAVVTDTHLTTMRATRPRTASVTMKPARLTLLLSPHSARRLSSRDPRDETRAVSSSGACSSERGMAVMKEAAALSSDRHMITDTRFAPSIKTKSNVNFVNQ